MQYLWRGAGGGYLALRLRGGKRGWLGIERPFASLRFASLRVASRRLASPRVASPRLASRALSFQIGSTVRRLARLGRARIEKDGHGHAGAEGPPPPPVVLPPDPRGLAIPMRAARRATWPRATVRSREVDGIEASDAGNATPLIERHANSIAWDPSQTNNSSRCRPQATAGSSQNEGRMAAITAMPHTLRPPLSLSASLWPPNPCKSVKVVFSQHCDRKSYTVLYSAYFPVPYDNKARLQHR